MGTLSTVYILARILGIAIGLGAVVGVIVGKVLAKRARPDYKPLLSRKESVVYAVSVLLGLALILFGALYTFPTGDETAMPDEGFLFAGEAEPDGGEIATADGEVAYAETAEADV